MVLIFSLVLYMIYFPKHLKYQRVLPLGTPPMGYGALAAEHHHSDPVDTRSIVEERINGYRREVQTSIGTTPEWRLAVTLAWVVAVHLYVRVEYCHWHELIPQIPLITSSPEFTGPADTIGGIPPTTRYIPRYIRDYPSYPPIRSPDLQDIPCWPSRRSQLGYNGDTSTWKCVIRYQYRYPAGNKLD
jgi:hypothetical protein